MKSKKKSYFIITLVSLLILLSSVLSAQDIEINNISHFSTSPLIINEIMFKPNTSAGNKEWIEIFNRSENPISLINFQICDATYNWKNIVSDKVIAPEEYIVLARTTDTLAIQNYYETQIEFAGTDGWNSLNNDDDIVLLADNNNVILDSMSYSVSGSYTKDISLERENPFDDEEIVWDACIDISGATPGTTNSISPLEYDIQAYKIIVEEQDESNLSITGYCENVGFNSLSVCQCTLFVDNNFNKQLDEGEEIYEETFSISSGEIDTFIVNFEIPEENYYSFGFMVENEDDMNAQNNQVFTTYNSPF
ncbi:MAG: lamin tail domain-containing protein, partial [Candidatus Cloacimonetes bacterium]|nr:lamin tail domain-containing protein [Candidatus Cloacimonadota bacterium]